MDFRLTDPAIVHPNLLRFVEHCRSLSSGEQLPLASSFLLRDVHWLFGFVAIAEVLEGGRDYRYSHVGDFWRAILNYNISETRLSELEASGRFPNVRSNYDSAVRERCPRYRAARLTWPDRSYLRYERMVYPFVDEAGAVTMLVVAVQCDSSIPELRESKSSGEPRLVLELTEKKQKKPA